MRRKNRKKNLKTYKDIDIISTIVFNISIRESSKEVRKSPAKGILYSIIENGAIDIIRDVSGVVIMFETRDMRGKVPK